MRLKKRYDIGILTNWNEEKTDRKLAALGITRGIQGELSVVLHSDNMGTKKPDPKVFSKVLAKYPSSQVIYIGDSRGDLQASRWAGVRFLWVLSGTTTGEEFIRMGIDKRNLFPNVEEAILNILKDD